MWKGTALAVPLACKEDWGLAPEATLAERRHCTLHRAHPSKTAKDGAAGILRNAQVNAASTIRSLCRDWGLSRLSWIRSSVLPKLVPVFFRGTFRLSPYFSLCMRYEFFSTLFSPCGWDKERSRSCRIYTTNERDALWERNCRRRCIAPTLRKPRTMGQPAPLACAAVGVAIRRQLLGDECGASDRFSLRSVVLTLSQRARKRAQGLWKGTALAVPLACKEDWGLAPEATLAERRHCTLHRAHPSKTAKDGAAGILRNAQVNAASTIRSLCRDWGLSRLSWIRSSVLPKLVPVFFRGTFRLSPYFPPVFP